MKYLSTSAPLVTALVVLLARAPAASADKPLGDMTGDWRLFVDDYLVASKTNVERQYHPFQKHKANPLILPDQPWEKDVVSVNTVLPNEDGTGYRMWYYCWTYREGKRRSYNCYAVSKDGITWEKPDLGLTEGPDGTKHNNIVPGGGSSIIHTPWHPDPQRRYHAVTGGKYFASASPDGLHWTRLSQDSVVSGGDVGNFRYDPHRRKFLAYVKVGSNVSGLSRRSVGFAESSDITRFPELVRIMAPDDFDDRWVNPNTVQRTHFYGCPVFLYESMYLGMLWIYEATDLEEGYFHGPIYTQLVTSQDGFHWHRQEGDRTSMLAQGKPPRSWDQGMIVGQSMIRVGDELRLYYSGYDGPHDYLPFHSGIGLATLRKDGFASIDAGDGPGEVVTRRIRNGRDPLHLNYRAGGGDLRVEILDGGGRVLPGFSRDDCDPLEGDHVDRVVTFGGKPAWPDNVDTVRLRFVMRNASLFSFLAGAEIEVLEEPAPTPLQALYTFEGEWMPSLKDKLFADDYQELDILGTFKRDRDAANAAKGKQSLKFASPWHPLHRIRIKGTTELGTQFTLALFAQNTDKGPARLFSAYNGNRPCNTSELIFDCDPRGNPLPGLRLVCKGIPITSPPARFDDGQYHHMAVTYDDGYVRFYLDGKPLGDGHLPGGAPVKLCRDLMVGEDLELGSDEQLRGNLDDILVYGRALTAGQIASLASQGAETFIGADGSLHVTPAPANE